MRIRFGIVVFLAALFAAATADARHMTLLGRTTSGPISDGERYVAYRAEAGRRVVTVDTRSGRKTRFRLSKRCYAPLGFSAGRIVVLCYSGNDSLATYPRFFTRYGTRVRTAGTDAYDARFRSCRRQGCIPNIVDLGDEWVKTRWEDGSQPTWDFTSLRTGEVRPLSTSPDEVEDVDRPSLTVPLCAPLRRTPTTSTTVDGTFEPFVYRSPWAVATHSATVRGIGYFELLRCGRKHRAFRSHGPSDAVGFTSRHLAWMELQPHPAYHYTLHVLRLGTQRRRSWRMGLPHQPEGQISVVLTRHWAYAFNPARNGASGTLTRARLP